MAIDLFPEWPSEVYPLYLYPSRHLPAAKGRAFIDFVLEALGSPERALAISECADISA